ncbi:MAG TPA: hypothetical protein EYP36_10600 [Calditrichaeota bacterium]|nr:hypothetical protein [Calditrichota bacterium]
MQLYKNFLRIEITPIMREIAVYHARRRSAKIKRRFIPAGAPLSAPESNFVGALGEIAVRYLISGEEELEDDYDAGKTDRGDAQINGKMYDVKSEAIPLKYYNKLYTGSIKAYEPYGCRVWTAKHLKHLTKYNGGVIFTAMPIADTEEEKQEDALRASVTEQINHLILIGYTTPDQVQARRPGRYSPPHPHSGKRFRYHSPNFIFHHSELLSVKNLLK